MNRTTIKIGIAMLAMGTVAAWAGEKEIEVDELPVAVLAAAKTACPKGVVKEASMEKEHGVVAYEVEMKVGKMGCDLKIAADGTLLETETQVAQADLPKKVKTTLAKFEDIDVEKAELVKEKDEAAFYEMDVEINDQDFELKISEKGKIIGLESKGKKKHDEDEDDDGEHEHGDKD